MSGIIKKVTNHKKECAALCLLAILILCLGMLRLYVPAAVLVFAATVNGLTVRKMDRQKSPFGTRSRTRNVDCLVIGDVDLEKAAILAGEGTAVRIYSPGCTLAGAYELLRHTFSILKEDGGRAVLAVKEKNMGRNRYSLFDVGFFHTVTINRLKLKNVKFKSRLPVVFAPVRSLQFLSGIGPLCNRKTSVVHQDEEIAGFCSERGIKVEILMI